MNLVFDEADYEVIPKPKRTWVMERIKEGLEALRGENEDDVQYAFVLEDRGFVTGPGTGMGDALDRLGVNKVQKFDDKYVLRKGTVELARKEGWYEEIEAFQYAFRTEKGVEVSHGTSPAEAWRGLGYEGMTTEWMKLADAKAAGWFETMPASSTNPLEV